MGLRSWWAAKRQTDRANRLSIEINTDSTLIRQQVPELDGVPEMEGMAYVLEQIREWKSICSQEEAATLASRLGSSQEAWRNDGLVMPYWGNLWVLRTLQAELGYDAPKVAHPIAMQ